MRYTKTKFSLLVVFSMGMLFQLGCAGVAQPRGARDGPSGAQNSQQASVLYLPSSNSNIPGFAIDPSTGLLKPLPGSPYTTGGNSLGEAIAEDPAHRFLFVGNVPAYPHGQQEGDASLSVFERDLSTGVLSLKQSNVLIRPDPVSLAVDRLGRFLYTYGDSTGGHVYAIDPVNGTLTEISGSPFQNFVGRGLIASPTMPFLYSVSDFGLQVFAYRLDQITGEPTPIPGSPFSISSEFPVADAIDPAGQFLYVLNAAPGPNLEVFRIQPDGTLSRVPGSPFQAGNGGLSLATSPSGDFFFVSTSGDSRDLYSFRLDRSTGQITQVSQVGIQDQSLAIRGVDTSGRFLYAVGGSGFFLFRIDATTGTLSLVGPAIASTP